MKHLCEPVARCDTVQVPKGRELKQDRANGLSGGAARAVLCPVAPALPHWLQASRGGPWKEGCLFLIIAKALVPAY